MTSVCSIAGISYTGALICKLPPYVNPPPAGVDWQRGSIPAEEGNASVANASSVYADGPMRYQALFAFDGETDNNFWMSEEGMPQWLQYTFTKEGPASRGSRLASGVRMAIAGYSITARPGLDNLEEGVVHNLYGLYDAPSSWQLEGSFDGVTWFTIHSMVDVLDWHESEEKRFECPPYLNSTNDPAEVGYYRLLILDVVGRPGGTKFAAISEFGLYAQSPGLLTVDVGLSTDLQTEASRELYFAYYRPFSFYHMYPMSGNINGGTEIHFYGEGFINFPDLRCLFELLYTEAVYYSPTHIVCPSPEQQVLSPKVTLTINGKDSVSCQNCTWVPGRCADPEFCSWDCNPTSFVQTDRTTGYSWCESQNGGCYYGATDSLGRCVDLVQFDSFTYYRFPVVLEISPTAGPCSGGTAITATGSFLQPFIGGQDIYCRLGDVAFRGNYLPSLDNQGSIVCTTPPGIAPGQTSLRLSFNGAQWDNRGSAVFLFYPDPMFSALIPSSTPMNINFLPGALFFQVTFPYSCYFHLKSPVRPSHYNHWIEPSVATGRLDLDRMVRLDSRGGFK